MAPYHLFHATVVRIEDISPSFRRVAFTGEDISDWAHGGRDQRVKVLTRSAAGTLPLDLLGEADWYGTWRALPDEEKPPMRTYTGREFNFAHETAHGADEIVIDFVRHGDHGPASRWVGQTFIGDEVVLVGPSARGAGREGGIEFAPPASARRIILAGDETAAPAICSIIEDIARSGALEGLQPVDIRAFIEVPHDQDFLPCAFADHPRVKLSWLGRGYGEHGSALSPAVKNTVTSRVLHECSIMCESSCIAHSDSVQIDVAIDPFDFTEVDVDSEILWDVQPPSDSVDGPSCYAWIAGEASVVKGLRRHLVSELGMDRRSVAFMGYWREGRSEIG